MIPTPMRLLASLVPLMLLSCAGTPPPEDLTMEEAMARMTELAAPSEGHARLEPLVGTFSSTMTMWMEPGAEATESPGTATNRWILGGRYLQQDYEADFMGMPFKGVGTTAYDNSTGRYQGSWIDNMSTYMLPISEGTWDEATRSITSYRSFIEPMSGLETTTRDVVRILSNDEHRFEMHEKKGSGAERQLFEIVYTRTR